MFVYQHHPWQPGPGSTIFTGDDASLITKNQRWAHSHELQQELFGGTILGLDYA